MKLLPFAETFRYKAEMKSAFVRKTALAGGLAAALSVAWLPSSHGQINFFGAPAPSDIVDESDSVPVDTAGTDGEVADEAPGFGIFASKPFRISVAIRQGYDSNANTSSTNPDESFYTNIAAGLTYSFGSSRLSLNTGVGVGATFYYTNPQDDVQFNGRVFLNATYLATPRLTLGLSTVTTYLPQPDLTLVDGSSRQNGDYLYSSTTISADYQISELFSSVTSYNFTSFYYLEPGLNQNQGQINQTISESLLYLWKPKTTLVAEYRFSPQNYFDSNQSSYQNYFLLGFNQTFNPRFTWSVRAGGQLNLNNNPVDGQSTYVGPFMESILRYQFGSRSSLLWNMRYGTETSGFNNVTQRQTFRTGLFVNTGLTRRISLKFGMNYQCNYFDQPGVIPSFYENVVDFSVGASYAINRFAALEVGYQYTIVIAPDYTGQDYTRNVVFAGINFSL